MKLIPLTRGQFAIVDDADFDWLSQWKWLSLNARYAARFEWNKGSKKIILLHRFIMNAPAHLEVDHKNQNKLDCQRSNLRLATHAQNMQNKGKLPNKKGSSFKGVYIDKSKWAAVICFNNKTKKLGIFPSELEAARAYDAAAIQHFGEFACLNFPTI